MTDLFYQCRDASRSGREGFRCSRREKEFPCRIENGYRSATWTGSFAFVITRVAITFTAQVCKLFLERVSAFSPVFILFSGPRAYWHLFGLAIVVDALPVDEEFDCGFDEGTLPRLTITGQSSLSPVIHSYSKLTEDVV